MTEINVDKIDILIAWLSKLKVFKCLTVSERILFIIIYPLATSHYKQLNARFCQVLSLLYLSKVRVPSAYLDTMATNRSKTSNERHTCMSESSQIAALLHGPFQCHSEHRSSSTM